MVPAMKPFAALLLGIFSVALAAAPNGEVARIHTVYLLPMNNGLDQYLANRLTNSGVFRVVTDPKKADALLTDRLGAAFEKRLAELYPEQEPEAAPKKETKAAKSTKPAEAAKSPKAATAGKSDEPASETKDAAETASSFTVKDAPAAMISSFRRAKGTVFLVDAVQRSVVWSVYDEPKNSSSAELDRTAARIAELLKKETRKK